MATALDIHNPWEAHAYFALCFQCEDCKRFLFRRGKTHYAENATAGKQESLRTKDEVEAQRILAAKNEAANNSKVTPAVGKAYLAFAAFIPLCIRKAGFCRRLRGLNLLPGFSFSRLCRKDFFSIKTHFCKFWRLNNPLFFIRQID
jgi:hypothetical protein